MKLTENDIRKFQSLHLQRFGSEISSEKTLEEGIKLLNLISRIQSSLSPCNAEVFNFEKRENIKNSISNTEVRADNWLSLSEKTFDFATYARIHFLKGDIQIKREIFNALGQNFWAKDGKLRIEANSWLVPIQNEYPNLEKEYLRLEPSLRCNNNESEELRLLKVKWGD